MLSLAEVKAHLRETSVLQDNLINSLITAAYQFAENYTNRVITQRVETLKLDDFREKITLPYLPVNSVTSVSYYDTEDTQQTFADYYLDLRNLFATIKPKMDFSWPETNQDYENVTITYDVGYTNIPKPIDQAVLLIIGSMYEQRENHIIGVSINKIPVSAEYLLNPYRVVSV